MTFIPMDIGINNYKVFEHLPSSGSREIGQSCYREIHGELHTIKRGETLPQPSQFTI